MSRRSLWTLVAIFLGATIVLGIALWTVFRFPWGDGIDRSLTGNVAEWLVAYFAILAFGGLLVNLFMLAAFRREDSAREILSEANAVFSTTTLTRVDSLHGEFLSLDVGVHNSGTRKILVTSVAVSPSPGWTLRHEPRALPFVVVPRPIESTAEPAVTGRIEAPPGTSGATLSVEVRWNDGWGQSWTMLDNILVDDQNPISRVGP